MQKNEILEETYKILAKHEKNELKRFTLFMKFANEKIKDPDFKETDIKSEKKMRRVEDIRPMADNKSTITEDVKTKPEAQNAPITILNYKGKEYLLDGNNRVRFWYEKGDMNKELLINYHCIE